MNLSSHRAVARIAWRQARRSTWRTALVVTMVAIPIAALSFTAVVIETVMPTPEERAMAQMGSTDLSVQAYSDRLRPRAIAARLPPGATLLTRRLVATQNIVRGSLIYLPLDEFNVPVDRSPARGIYTVLEGRAPSAPGQVALHPDDLKRFGTGIGGRIRLEDVALTLQVTGTVVGSDRVGDRMGVVGPGTLEGRKDAFYSGFYVDLPEGAPLQAGVEALDAVPGVEGVATRRSVGEGDQHAEALATGASFAGAVLALFLTGLIAAAAFVVGASRQLRTLGLIGATGGERSHLRATVLYGGATSGLVGSVAGAAVGIAGAFAVHPYLDTLAGRVVGPVETPVLAVAGAVALGTVAATVAAAWPARSAARLSTVQALAGRTPLPKAPGKLAALGLVVILAGLATIVWGTVADAEAVLTSGLMLAAIGFLVAIPLLVTWLGRFGSRLPTAARLAARDIGRHGRRTAAALAAATIVLATPIAFSALTLSDEAREHQVPFMASDHLSVTQVVPHGDPAPRIRALLGDLHGTFPGALILPLRVAAFDAKRYPLPRESGGRWTATVEGTLRTTTEGVAYREGGSLLIGGPDLLRALHADEGVSDLQAGRVVAIGPDGTDRGVVHLRLPPDASGRESTVDLPAAAAGPTRYASITPDGEFNYVISSRAAAELGLRPARDAAGQQRFVLRASRPLGGGDVARAKEVAARHPGAFVLSGRDLGTNASPVRLSVSIAAGTVALAIVAVVVALVAAESRRAQAILVAVGGEPRTRRRVAAANALLLAALASQLAVPAGIAPVIALQTAKQGGYPIVVPWQAIGMVLVAVPAFAGLMGVITSRQPRAAALLRPIA